MIDRLLHALVQTQNEAADAVMLEALRLGNEREQTAVLEALLRRRAVRGMIGGVGQRMLTSVSRRMAGEFFSNVDSAIAGGPVAATVAAPAGATVEPGAPAPTGAVFTPPVRAASPAGSQQDFLTGVAVGAGLVLLGAVVGGLLGRRR